MIGTKKNCYVTFRKEMDEKNNQIYHKKDTAFTIKDMYVT